MSRFMILAVCATLFCGTAKADVFVESYAAVLSAADHYNTNGTRLKNVAAIIRQDRANYHKFGMRDEGDQDDAFFASSRNREILERLLKRGKTTRSVREAIVNGTPKVLVSLYQTDGGDNYIDVVITE